MPKATKQLKGISRRLVVSWDKRLEEIKQYKQQNGNCNVSQHYKANPQLANWVNEQRQLYKKNKLLPDRFELLHGIGFEWQLSRGSKPSVEGWNERFKELKQYKQQNGNCRVPANYTANPQLGNWVKLQRQLYKRGDLLPDRIELLKRIGFEWELRRKVVCVDWNERFEQLKQYKKDDGNCDVSNLRRLGKWVHNQCTACRKGKLSKESIKLLDEIGFSWNPGKELRKVGGWEERFKELKEYNEENGHCKVPQKHPQLGKWVMHQRRLYKKGKLLPDRIELLDDIGFQWIRHNIVSWNERLEELKQYKEKHGDCDVPSRYKANPQLATWVAKQRWLYKNGELSDEQSILLDEIGFSWNPDEDSWNKRFKELTEYKEKNGDFRVPRCLKLGEWVSNQRRVYKNGKLLPDRIKLLEGIGFVWKPSRGEPSQKRFDAAETDNLVSDGEDTSSSGDTQTRIPLHRLPPIVWPATKSSNP